MARIHVTGGRSLGLIRMDGMLFTATGLMLGSANLRTSAASCIMVRVLRLTTLSAALGRCGRLVVRSLVARVGTPALLTLSAALGKCGRLTVRPSMGLSHSCSCRLC